MMSAPLLWLCTSSPLRAGRPMLQVPRLNNHSSVSCRHRLPRQCARCQDTGLDNLQCPDVPVMCPCRLLSRELTYMRSVCLSRPHTRRPLLRLRRLLHMHDGVPHTPSSVRPGASRRDEAPTWSCGFERSSYAAVKKHEWRCQAPLHPTERAPSMGPQAEQESSGCSTAPESTGASAAVGSQGAVGARPAHAARIKWVLPVQVRQVAQLLRPSTRAACSQCGAPELTLSGSFVLLINSCRPLGRWGHGEGA